MNHRKLPQGTPDTSIEEMLVALYLGVGSLTHLSRRGFDKQLENPAIANILEELKAREDRLIAEPLERVLKNGHGGGNFRRLIEQELAHLRKDRI